MVPGAEVAARWGLVGKGRRASEPCSALAMCHTLLDGRHPALVSSRGRSLVGADTPLLAGTQACASKQSGTERDLNSETVHVPAPPLASCGPGAKAPEGLLSAINMERTSS